MEVILYSTNCPKCFVLEKKLNEKNIQHKTITDADIMIKRGFTTAPMLEVDEELMDFGKAVNWVNER